MVQLSDLWYKYFGWFDRSFLKRWIETKKNSLHDLCNEFFLCFSSYFSKNREALKRHATITIVPTGLFFNLLDKKLKIPRYNNIFLTRHFFIALNKKKSN
jgi:hypothetical protein